MHRALFVLLPLAIALSPCHGTPEALVTDSEPLKTGSRRGARFLGLLGLLTGLTLVDSLDDDGDGPRRSGFVKIDVGRPASLDALYGAYGGYTGGPPPYWPGGSSINIKIPFRPGGGGDFETMALFPFPLPYPSGSGQFGGFTHHGNPTAIEPRPSIFADPIPNGSNGSGAVLADEVEASTRKNKASTKKSTVRTRINPPRTIRSTLRGAEPEEDVKDAAVLDYEEPAPVTTLDTETIVEQNEASTTVRTPAVANTTDISVGEVSPPEIASDAPEPQTASLASIVQDDLNYVTQPTVPAAYESYPNSLADVATIELTTDRAADFQPSRSDHWQNYYSSVAHGDQRAHHQHQRSDFLPIAPIPPAY